MARIGTDIGLASTLLRKGEIVAMPTETVYGLAGNAYDETAMAKIFAIKKRPSSHPLIVHIATINQLYTCVDSIPSTALELAAACWPGPLTLLLPQRKNGLERAAANSNYIALRIPAHPMALALLAKLPFPLAAPSANPFGYISPTQAKHVDDQLGSLIPYILDGGPCKVGLESTIVGFDGEQPVIYRLGGIPVEQIQAITNRVPHLANLPASLVGKSIPGSLLQHYAPSKPLYLGDVDTLVMQHKNKKLGILTFDQYYPGIPTSQQIVLSPQGSLTEAAQQLFDALRTLDSLAIEAIIAAPLPSVGLGQTINDRLWRASDKKS